MWEKPDASSWYYFTQRSNHPTLRPRISPAILAKKSTFPATIPPPAAPHIFTKSACALSPSERQKLLPQHAELVDKFVRRLGAILPWDHKVLDATVHIKRQLSQAGTPIGEIDTASAGHAIASGCMLVGDQ
ncbi:type II toxin-antitoxin system VapC family toxin [Pistricoccus aurantiacus]|uniref:Type II toxin-antitoxin system VapC family toxin n=1 Tax=Pistricoccus aurantiacus TaxID=1883414 RepID=A0A5B8SV56_9GAMM|nr:type II toxin-antitoxin system VapC family toxin [Pistricoccus aurantiacus]QEA40281.1 type II toxin-antitoxin system VapC family toxin [Pistricoccus aurantiacus]